MRILIVEDDPDQRVALTMALEMDGHHIRQAATGEDALALMDGVDVVLLDLDLGPGIDGWEVARRKLRVPSIAPIPVIVITGEPIEAVHGRHADSPLAGALLLMSKPADLHRLDRALKLLARDV